MKLCLLTKGACWPIIGPSSFCNHQRTQVTRVEFPMVLAPIRTGPGQVSNQNSPCVLGTVSHGPCFFSAERRMAFAF